MTILCYLLVVCHNTHHHSDSKCGGLNRIGPFRVRYLNVGSFQSGSIRRCVLVDIGVGFARGNVSLRVAFGVSNAQSGYGISLFLLPANINVDLSTSCLAPGLPTNKDINNKGHANVDRGKTPGLQSYTKNHSHTS